MFYKMMGMVLAMSLGISPLSAKNVIGDSDQIAQLLKKEGYRAELETDGVGDPMINSGMAGYNFGIFFYGCNDESHCNSVQFRAYFTPKESVSLDRINQWNYKNRFGSMSLDEDDDVMLNMDINLEDGGMSEELFLDNIEYWQTVLVGAADYIFPD